MPYGEIAAVSGSVASVTVAAGVSGRVSNPAFVAPGFVDDGFFAPGSALATVNGTVGVSYVAALAGRSTAIGYRIKLNGAWVPDEALAGPVQISDSLDTHRASARFSLAGREWGVMRTLSTWTRVPVEIWFREGAAGADLEETLEFRGWIIPGTRQSAPQLEPVVELQADDSSIYDDHQICHEVEPHAGLTRGQIAAELAADVGIDQVDAPDGAVYNKPLFTDQANLFAFLRDLGEPEGWHWRLAPDAAGPGHVLVAYTAEIKPPPQAPDHTWTLDDVDSIDVGAPERPASRYVVRGLGAVIIGEAGERTEVERIKIEGVQPPLVATQRQNADGSLVPSGKAPTAASDQLYPLSELVTMNTTRAGKDVRQVVIEYGWFAPSAARLETGTGDGLGPVDGYYFAPAFILEDGSYVAWQQQRWVQVGERIVENVYDSAGQMVEVHVEESRWHRRRRAIRQTSDVGAGPTVSNTGIGDDDASWSLSNTTDGLSPIEAFGRARAATTELHYGIAGAVWLEVTTEEGWHSRRTTIDPGHGYYVLYGGHGQEHLEAQWGIAARRSVAQRVGRDGRLHGVTEETVGWHATRVPEGFYDWGDSRAQLPIEAFRPTSRKHTTYRTRADGTFEELTLSTDQPPTSRLIAGRPPLPRFKLSAWTTFRQQPIEVVLDDATLEALFGFRRDVLVMDHLLDLEEAQRVARRRRRDDTSRTVTVRRFETRGRPGDTVLLIDPSNGLHHRALLADRQRSRDLSRPDAPAVYTLRVPM